MQIFIKNNEKIKNGLINRINNFFQAPFPALIVFWGKEPKKKVLRRVEGGQERLLSGFRSEGEMLMSRVVSRASTARGRLSVGSVPVKRKQTTSIPLQSIHTEP